MLEGSVRKSGDRVRITAQLIAADDGFHVWSKNFDRQLTDIFALQDEIAGDITSALRLSLVGGGRDSIDANSTDSIEAYELFLEARQLIQGRSVAGLQRDFDEADQALVRALELNPSHSDALNWRAINLRIAGRLRDELAARQQLLEMDPLHLSNLFNLSVAHLLRGQTERALNVARRLKGDFPNSPWGDLAEVEALMGSGRLARAQELAREKLAGGNSMLVSSASNVNMRLGCFDAAIEVIESPFALALAGQEQFEAAVAAARDSAAASPGDSNAVLSLLRVLSLAGHHEAVLEYFEQQWGSLDALQTYFGFGDMTAEVTPIAAAQSSLGQTEALDKTLAHWGARLADPRKEGYVLPYFRFIEAGFEALAGSRERGLALLEQSVEGGYLNPLLEIEPKFHKLREDPEFQRLVARNLELIDAEREKLGGCGT